MNEDIQEVLAIIFFAAWPIAAYIHSRKVKCKPLSASCWFALVIGLVFFFIGSAVSTVIIVPARRYGHERAFQQVIGCDLGIRAKHGFLSSSRITSAIRPCIRRICWDRNKVRTVYRPERPSSALAVPVVLRRLVV